MEYVEGEQLNEYIKNQDVSLAERLKIIRTVVEAVAYAHRQGVVHRDLKPQNVLIDATGEPHVVDFGIAKKLALAGGTPPAENQQEGHEGPVGTLGYIAPEQEKGGPIDSRADIFALGALLFHTVTGEPARLATVADQRDRVLRDRGVPQPDDLSAVIARCVQPKPEDRYSTCDDLYDDLTRYLAGRRVATAEPSNWLYEGYRGLLLAIREYPISVAFAIWIVAASTLTWYFWAVEANIIGKMEPEGRTVMIGLTAGTIEAIEDGVIGQDLPGLDPTNPKSFRMLYGALFKRLALAKPLVVVVDSWVEDCVEEYDPYLIDGIKTLDAPVVFGANCFNINGDPVTCDAVRAVAAGFGTIMGADAGKHPHAYEVTYCLQRGFDEPIPGLALAGYLATRHPDSTPRLHMNPDEHTVRVRYQKKSPERDEYRWEPDEDEFDLHSVQTVAGNRGTFQIMINAGAVREGDMVGNKLVPARPSKYWHANRTFSFEQVLLASDEQVREWFGDRAILIGQMRDDVPDIIGDRHQRADGEEIYGCRLHAEALDALFSAIPQHRLHRAGLALRTGIWCLVGILLANIVRLTPLRKLWHAALLSAALITFSMLVGGSSLYGYERWTIEVVIASSCATLAAGVWLFLYTVRRRQLGLTPSAIKLTSEAPTMASTVLAETR